MRETIVFSVETYPLIEEIGKTGEIELVDEDKKVVLKIIFD